MNIYIYYDYIYIIYDYIYIIIYIYYIWLYIYDLTTKFGDISCLILSRWCMVLTLDISWPNIQTWPVEMAGESSLIPGPDLRNTVHPKHCSGLRGKAVDFPWRFSYIVLHGYVTKGFLWNLQIHWVQKNWQQRFLLKWNLQPEQYQICQICDLPGPQTISTVIPISDFPMVD